MIVYYDKLSPQRKCHCKACFSFKGVEMIFHFKRWRWTFASMMVCYPQLVRGVTRSTCMSRTIILYPSRARIRVFYVVTSVFYCYCNLLLFKTFQNIKYAGSCWNFVILAKISINTQLRICVQEITPLHLMSKRTISILKIATYRLLTMSFLQTHYLFWTELVQ